MRAYSLPIFIFFLFTLSCIFLTVRQEMLLQEADQALVTLGYVEPANPENIQFVIGHESDTSRTLTLTYQYPGKPALTETLTLAPEEKRLLTPPEATPHTILVRYQDQNNQEQTLTLYKK